MPSSSSSHELLEPLRVEMVPAAELLSTRSRSGVATKRCAGRSGGGRDSGEEGGRENGSNASRLDLRRLNNEPARGTKS